MTDRPDERRSSGAAAEPFRTVRGPSPLRDDQIDVLRRYGETRPSKAGELLFRAGDINDFFVVLEGEVTVIDDFAGDIRTMGVFGPGTFLGDLHMLTGQGVPLSATVSVAGELLAIPREQLKKVVTEEFHLSNLLLDTFMARRLFMMKVGVGLRIIGSHRSKDATRLREFATRNRLPHVWIDVDEQSENAEALLARFAADLSELPVAVWQGTHVLKNPTNPELARVMGLKVDLPRERSYDLVVVGAGPAGFGAAVYGASEGLSTLALESVSLGGQAGTSSRIENYLGFPVGLSGFELATRALAQADKFGAQTAVPEEAVSLRRENGSYRIRLAEGGEILARSVIAATGARYQRLDVPELERFEGISVHYAATEAEVQRFEGEHVLVVGGRKLRGTGGGVSGRTHASGLAAHQRRRPEQGDVEIPCRPRHGSHEHRAAREHRGPGAPWRGHPGGRCRRGQPLGRPPDPRREGTVRLHRGSGQHGVAPGSRGTRQTRLRPDWTGAGRIRARGRRLAKPLAGAVPPGDEPAGGVRGRRCPQRFDQTLRLRGRRGGDGGVPGAPVSGRVGRVKATSPLQWCPSDTEGAA